MVVEGSKELKDAITTRLRPTGYGFWHWMEDLWLISGVNDKQTAREMAAWLEKEVPALAAARYLVIHVGPPDDYWGRGPEGSWKWFLQNWRPTR